MGKYQAYPEYKDSGIRWVDKIPSTWSTAPIKSIAKIVNGATPKSGVEEFWDGDVAWITPADMGKQPTPYINSGARNITVKGYESCGTSLVPAGSIVLSARAPIGSLAIALNKLCTNQGCKSLIPTEKIHNKFLYYVLNSSTEQLNVLGRGTTFLELSADELGCFSFSLPPIEEQSVIANFLDHETAKIDTLIEKQQQLIQLLKEKRQAVISHAVTKGISSLNGGPNAPMKDSGVEWLGEVPEHWGVTKLKFACSLISKKISTEQKNVIALENIESWTGKYIDTASEYSGEDVGFVKDDILFGKLRPYLAKVFQAKDEGVAFGDLIVFRPVALLSDFCFYLMISEGFITTVDSSTYGSKMPRASVEFIAEMFVAVPPQREQAEIVQYIQSKLAKFDNVEAEATSAIQLMQERRTALISAAVTGKIDVRDWQAPQN